MDTKICQKCREDFPIESFYKNRAMKDGLCHYCKPCLKKSLNKTYKKHRAKKDAYIKKWKEKNPDYYKKYHKSYKLKHPDRVRQWNLECYQRNKNDIQKRLKTNIRSRFYQAFKKGWKNSSVIDFLGCTFGELAEYLESQFDSKMTWDNYATYWEIDHIKQLSLCDHTNVEELKIFWNYSNLRPLEVSKNRSRPKK